MKKDDKSNPYDHIEHDERVWNIFGKYYEWYMHV
jgi:hypothetical protein